MYKLDKSAFKAGSHKENETGKIFYSSDSIEERLRQAWYLTAGIYGIDPGNPPKMDKYFFSTRKHASR